MHRKYVISNREYVVGWLVSSQSSRFVGGPVDLSEDRRGPAAVPGSGLRHRLRRLYAILGGQERVAERIGVAKGTPGRWVRGESRMSLDDAAELCAAADVSLEWLAYGGPLRNRADWLEAGAVYESAELVLEVARDLDRPVDPGLLARTIRDRAANLTRDRHAAGDVRPEPAGGPVSRT